MVYRFLLAIPLVVGSATVIGMTRDANSIMYYYQKQFGNDFSGLPYFVSVTPDEVELFARIIGRPKFIERYALYSTGEWLEFGDVDLSSPFVSVLPSMFVLNEVNKIILDSVRTDFPWVGVPYDPSIPQAVVDTLRFARDDIFRAVRQVGDRVGVVPSRWVESIDRIVYVHRILTQRGLIAEPSVFHGIIVNCMFSAMTMEFRMGNDSSDLFYGIIRLLHGMILSSFPDTTEVQDLLEKLFGVLRLAEKRFNSIEGLPDAVLELETFVSTRTNSGVFKKRYSPNMGTLETAMAIMNVAVDVMPTYAEKSYNWYMEMSTIASVDFLAKSGGDRVIADVPSFLEKSLNNVKRQPQTRVGALGAEYLKAAHTLIKRHGNNRGFIPTVAESFLIVYAHTVINRYYANALSLYMPGHLLHQELAAAASAATNALIQIAEPEYAQVAALFDVAGRMILSAHHIAWVARSPAYSVIPETMHALFDLTVAYYLRWSFWAPDLVMPIQNNLLAIISTSSTEPIPTEALQSLQEMKRKITKTLDEVYYVGPENGRLLTVWGRVSKRILNACTGTDDAVFYPHSETDTASTGSSEHY
jgi:hypothetical protein